MKASSRNANSPPRGQLPLPAEHRTPNAAQGLDEGDHQLQALNNQPWPRPPQEEGDFREYYRLR